MKDLKEYLIEKLDNTPGKWQKDGDVKFRIIQKHKDEIRPGDVIMVGGKLKTVGKKDIKHDSFMGTSIFGDGYKSGKELVDYCEIYHAK